LSDYSEGNILQARGVYGEAMMYLKKGESELGVLGDPTLKALGRFERSSWPQIAK
jgi:hypothetical protein